MTKGVSWQRQALTRRLERLGWTITSWGRKGGWLSHSWVDSRGERRVIMGFLRLSQVKDFADWLEAQVLGVPVKAAKEKGARGGRLPDLLKRMAKEDKR